MKLLDIFSSAKVLLQLVVKFSCSSKSNASFQGKRGTFFRKQIKFSLKLLQGIISWLLWSYILILQITKKLNVIKVNDFNDAP